jgi:hypothetical protein
MRAAVNATCRRAGMTYSSNSSSREISGRSRDTIGRSGIWARLTRTILASSNARSAGASSGMASSCACVADFVHVIWSRAGWGACPWGVGVTQPDRHVCSICSVAPAAASQSGAVTNTSRCTDPVARLEPRAMAPVPGRAGMQAITLRQRTTRRLKFSLDPRAKNTSKARLAAAIPTVCR